MFLFVYAHADLCVWCVNVSTCVRVFSVSAWVHRGWWRCGCMLVLIQNIYIYILYTHNILCIFFDLQKKQQHK